MEMPTDKYFAIARTLLNMIEDVWASEDAMAKEWAGMPLGSLSAFDRTASASALLDHLFKRAWVKYWVDAYHMEEATVPRMIARDALNIVAALPGQTTDFNLLSQIMPNLIPVSVLFDVKGLKDVLESTSAELDKLGIPNPRTVKKVKVDATWPAETQATFTKVAGLAKTASTFEKGVRAGSWRVSPFGKTPALSDVAGVCSLPVVADPYVYICPLGVAHLESADSEDPIENVYITWPSDLSLVQPVFHEDGQITIPVLPAGHETFKSESGGSMLSMVMQSRFLASWCWRAWASRRDEECSAVPGFFVLTKLNSLRLTGPRSLLQSIHTKFTAPEGLQSQAKDLVWRWGTRVPRPIEAPVE